MTFRTALGLLAACVLAWGSSAVQADPMDGGTSVLASQSVLVSQSGANTTALTIPNAGELFVSVTDLQFPTSFSANALQYAVSTTTATMGSPNGSLTNAGTLSTLNLTAPTTLYVNVFATLSNGGAGLYNMTATFVSAVPLPTSIFSFFGGAALLLTQLVRARPACTARRLEGEPSPAAICA